MSRQAAPRLRLYRFFAHLPWLRHSFKAKVLTIAFVGTHIPLLGILAYFLHAQAVTQPYALWVLGIALAATLAGSLATLLALHALLRPLDLALHMLDRFREARHLLRPEIALHDEMSTLIDGTRQTLEALDAHWKHAARHDETTGALNAHGFDRAMAALQSTLPIPVTMLRIRMRNFVQVQIGLARNEVEFVTCSMVNRLRLIFPEPARTAVLGPGQFAILIPGSIAKIVLEQRLNRALTDLNARLEIGTAQIMPICVLGVARADGIESLHDLPAAAEAALLAAEEQEGSNWVLASQGGHEQRTHTQLALELGRAIQEKQLFAVYQPRINTRTKTIESLEALARWRHPRRGVIDPDLFIPTAERAGKITEIGRHMLDQAVAQASAWQRAGRDVSVSVNLATAQITPTLVADIKTVLARHGALPRHLELEITETAVLGSPADSAATLQQIRELGVAVALDDFGTGYSSLSHLSRLPIDRIKIDRDFVARLHNTRDHQIVSGIVALCHALDLAVTAEGVETPEQAAVLLAMGCDEWQGFLFACPTASEEIDWQPPAFEMTTNAAHLRTHRGASRPSSQAAR